MPKLIKYKEYAAPTKSNPKTEELFIKCVNTYYKINRNYKPDSIIIFKNCIKFCIDREDGIYYTFEALKYFVSTAAKLKPIISDGDIVFYLSNLDFDVCNSILDKHNLKIDINYSNNSYGGDD